MYRVLYTQRTSGVYINSAVAQLLNYSKNVGARANRFWQQHKKVRWVRRDRSSCRICRDTELVFFTIGTEGRFSRVLQRAQGAEDLMHWRI